VSPKRGDRAAAPRPGEYDLRLANSESAKGWDHLCRQVPASTRTAYDAIRANPCPVPETPRHHRLKSALAWGTHNSRVLEQWQYEVTGGGRIWYLVDRDARTVWLTYAGTGHPKATDR
jgi:hypothetical protein